MAEFVTLEVDGSVATMRLDRPPMNALNSQVQAELKAAAREAGERDDVKSVVIYGGPKVFAAGADIKEMSDATYADMASRAVELSSCFTAIAKIPKPVIAAVTGYALGGGCELAMCADRRIAADSAKLGQPEILLGIIPGAGGTQRLPRLVGPAKAKDICFTGRFVDAEEALEIGLVDEVVAADQVYDAAVAYAKKFEKAASLAIRAAKESIDRGFEVDLDTGLAIESVQLAALFATDDQKIGMKSFVENGPGKAAFTGR
jgi:enoyl-CoA hydratase/carnithine racemase